MQEVDPELHDAGVGLLYGNVAVLLAAPELGEAGRHEVRQVILHNPAAGHLDCKKLVLEDIVCRTDGKKHSGALCKGFGKVSNLLAT